MAIAVQATLNISPYSASGVSSLTRSFTISGDNRYLLVGVLDVSGDSAISCTYGGVAMTQLAKVNALTSRYIYLYGLANPTTGTNDIVYTRSSTTSVCGFGAVNLTGAKQTTSPVDATNTHNSTGTSATINLVTSTDNSAVIVFGSGDSAYAASTNLTELCTDSSFDLALIARSATFPKTPAGSQDYTITCGSGNNGLLAVAIAPAKTMDYLVVAGGGSGGAAGGAGGGAGGHRYLTSQVVTAGSYTVTVGAGGAAVTDSVGGTRGNNGSDSSFNGTTSTGGGGGGAYANSSTNRIGKDGGSGGGGGWGSGSGVATGGAGTAGQGNNGGTGVVADSQSAGGGGGSGAVGANASGTVAGAGGNGTANSITGSSVTRAGGGGSGAINPPGTASNGGTGGAGNGTKTTPGGNATANTGSGGGGSGDAFSTSGAGGSGIVIVRLLTADWGSISGGTQTTDGAYTVVSFTSSGTLTLTDPGPPPTTTGAAFLYNFI